jgi:hypothetical protein
MQEARSAWSVPLLTAARAASATFSGVNAEAFVDGVAKGWGALGVPADEAGAEGADEVGPLVTLGFGPNNPARHRCHSGADLALLPRWPHALTPTTTPNG